VQRPWRLRKLSDDCNRRKRAGSYRQPRCKSQHSAKWDCGHADLDVHERDDLYGLGRVVRNSRDQRHSIDGTLDDYFNIHIELHGRERLHLRSDHGHCRSGSHRRPQRLSEHSEQR